MEKGTKLVKFCVICNKEFITYRSINSKLCSLGCKHIYITYSHALKGRVFIPNFTFNRSKRAFMFIS